MGLDLLIDLIIVELAHLDSQRGVRIPNILNQLFMKIFSRFDWLIFLLFLLQYSLVWLQSQFLCLRLLFFQFIFFGVRFDMVSDISIIKCVLLNFEFWGHIGFLLFKLLLFFIFGLSFELLSVFTAIL